jgi:Uncharacterized membrane protein
MSVELISIIRIIYAVILGFCIGFERTQRLKEAGVRTHAIVAAGACLITLISKYGFEDVNADGARIAAQIVSGIGFIGAGTILYKRKTVSGLTTAAGIWTTAGIGMAAGAGMYIIAGIVTLIIIFIQYILHKPFKIFRAPHSNQLKIVFENNSDEIEQIKSIFEIEKFYKLTFDRTKDKIYCIVIIETEKDYSESLLRNIFLENNFICSIDRMMDYE